MNRGMEILSPASYIGKSSWLFEESKGTKWTPEENKRFENALALFDKDTPDRWYNVAAMIPGKTVNDVMNQYRELVDDVSDIEAGLIPIPGYGSSSSNNSFTLEWVTDHGGSSVYDGLKQFYGPGGAGGKRNSSSRCSDQERKKGVPWTEEEHRYIHIFSGLFVVAFFGWYWKQQQKKIIILVQAIPVGTKKVWKRRLEKHIKKFCDHKDSNTSS